MSQRTLPLLPLLLDQVPPGLAEALAQEGVPTCCRAKRPSGGRFVLFDSRVGAPADLSADQTAIDVDRLRQGARRDPMKSLLDERSRRQQWRLGGVTVAEEVARVDRRAVRRQIMARLRDEIERAGGLWLTVSAYPFPYRSALNFRIDYDQFDARDFHATLDAVAGHEQATSHFVNAAAYLPHDDALRRLAGLDVGSHGYRHHTYRTFDENLANIGRGIETLRALGIEPSGFAAPGGRFNRGLLRAMEELGVGHSSEFGLAYDDVPFFPHDGRVLQVPVHPVSLGIFLEAVQGGEARRASAIRQAVSAATAHFRDLSETKYRAGEPLFFYGHPTGRLGRYPEVLRAVFETADGFGALWRTTMSRFAAWWRAREAVDVMVTARGDGYVLAAKNRPSEHHLAVEYWRGGHVARMPLSRDMLTFTPTALAYEQRPGASRFRPVRLDRPEGLRSRVRRWIDWERETPIEEIGTGTWGNRVKRALRQWRS